MKQRVISGVFIVLITLAAVLLSGYFFIALCAFIDIWGCKEVIDLRKDKKFSIPLYLTMLASTLLISSDILFFDINIQLITLLIELIVLLSIAVFDEEVSFLDCSCIFLMSVIIGFGTFFFMYFENISKYLFAYVIIISYVTDACAYFVGSMLGKHKLNERISPKKSIEGFIGGWFLGGIISLLFAYLFKFFYMPEIVIIIGSLTLPLLSQIGDLIFSMIKRFYDVKDYSNLIPGHGGLLDRLDSLLITSLFLGAICLVLV